MVPAQPGELARQLEAERAMYDPEEAARQKRDAEIAREIQLRVMKDLSTD